MSFFTTTSVLPAFIVTLLALISARLMVRDTSATDSHEFAGIDGLRGFLALFVFLHHSVFWFKYSHLQGWSGSSSALYTNFGQTSICLFFLLSGFLFGHKLLEGRAKEVDWLKLFCSRFLRLTPLYLTLVAIMLLIIAIESRFIQLDDTAILRSNIIDWVLFTVPGHPNINSHPDTHLMVAGVIWTLPYEWFFYFCLPLIGVLVGTKSKTNSAVWLILSCTCILTFSKWGLDTTLLYGFLGGGFAAFVVRTSWLKAMFKNKGADWILLAGLVISYTVFDNGTFFTRLFILSICIAFVASGANLFGILNSRPARALSTISYGIYLLHGLVLYLVMKYLIEPRILIQITELQHWLIIFFCTPLVIGFSTLSWYLIEWPAIKHVSTLTQFLRNMHSPLPKLKNTTVEKVDDLTIQKTANDANVIIGTEVKNNV